MLSNKRTFFLTRLVVMLVFCFAAASAMAQFEIKLSVAADEDISFADGNQVEYIRTTTINIASAQVVQIQGFPFSADHATAIGNSTIEALDFEVIAYNSFGGTVPPSLLSVFSNASPADGKNFTMVLNGVGYGTTRVLIHIPAGAVELADPRAELNDDGTRKNAGKNAAASIELHFVIPFEGDADHTGPIAQGVPIVHSIVRAGSVLLPVTDPTFQAIITLSEEPRKDGFRKDHIDVSNATAADPVFLHTIPRVTTAPLMLSSGRDGMLYRYVVTITPKYENKNDIVVKVKSFYDQEKQNPKMYTPPATEAGYTEGMDKLTVKVGREDLPDKTPGIVVPIPTGIVIPGTDPVSPVQNERGDNTEAAPAKVEVPDTTEAAPVKVEVPDTTEAAPAKVEVPDTSVMIPMEGRIYISEIMFAGGGRSPQWIEIANGSRTEQVNLSGWTLTVENATDDANTFVNEKEKFRIPGGTRIDPSGQHDTPSTILVVAKQGRNNLDGLMAGGQVVNLDISTRYELLSDVAFKITLAPPTRPIVPEWAAARDVVGNLTDAGIAAWALPMNEKGPRSSILRRHVSTEPKDGEMMDSWMLASDTGFTQQAHLSTQSYYGFPTDVGTPGFRAGGALPVELSHFHPARDKATGAVVITWSTQSELNNAGFFIKRSQQRDGQFKAINATIILGAGTTSAKQFYTYTDTTAQPNVVYYYQIEDVSLDGNRQTLTRGIRLKGHVGAAGKTTVIWGGLKKYQ